MPLWILVALTPTASAVSVTGCASTPPVESGYREVLQEHATNNVRCSSGGGAYSWWQQGSMQRLEALLARLGRAGHPSDRGILTVVLHRGVPDLERWGHLNPEVPPTWLLSIHTRGMPTAPLGADAQAAAARGEGFHVPDYHETLVSVQVHLRGDGPLDMTSLTVPRAWQVAVDTEDVPSVLEWTTSRP